jgi:hypothetical protein
MRAILRGFEARWRFTVALAALLMSCRPEGGLASRTPDDLSEPLDALEEALDAHGADVTGVSDAEALAGIEEAYHREAQVAVDQMYAAVQRLELCLREGEGRRMPWLTREIGGIGAESDRHRTIAGTAVVLDDAVREEDRHHAVLKKHIEAAHEHWNRVLAESACPTAGRR